MIEKIPIRIRVSKDTIQNRSWQVAQKKYDAVLAQTNEIFLCSATWSAISRHGCLEKPELRQDDA